VWVRGVGTCRRAGRAGRTPPRASAAPARNTTPAARRETTGYEPLEREREREVGIRLAHPNHHSPHASGLYGSHGSTNGLKGRRNARVSRVDAAYLRLYYSQAWS